MRDLRDYQSVVYAQMKDAPAFALFLEQGLGKTQIILHEFMQDDSDILVVAGQPNGLQKVWEEQIHENAMPVRTLSWEGKASKQFLMQFLDFKSSKVRKRVLLVNIEIFQSRTNPMFKNFIQILELRTRVTWVLDQSACIKNPYSLRTKNIKALLVQYGQYIVKRRILDGDPCSGGVSELYAQFGFLDPQIIGMRSYTAFVARYCVRNYFNGIEKDKTQNFEELTRKIAPYGSWLKTKDCIALPELITCRDYFTLSKPEQDYLKRAETEQLWSAQSNDDDTEDSKELQLALCTLSPLVALLQKQQVCSGLCEVLHGVASTKVVALRNLVMRFHEPVLIFCNYHFEIDLILTYLEGTRRALEYSGRNSEQRYANLDAFKCGRADVLVGTQASLGKGFTITNTRRIIFYSRNYSYRLYLESIKRVHRSTQERTVFVHDLISTERIEHDIVQCLQNKRDLLYLVEQGMKTNNARKVSPCVEL